MQTLEMATQGAYRLMHDGALAFADMEANGIRVDVDYLDRATADTEQEIRDREAVLAKTDEYKRWRKLFGVEMNLGSRQQLCQVVTGHKGSMDEAALQKIGTPFTDQYLRIEKLKKLVGTYLHGVRSQVVDGFLHAVFNLHLVVTFRSSSSDPNFQNIPIRDLSIGKVIRQAFVPRSDEYVLVEADYSQIEVRIAACYHKDPTMLDYINDPTKDMHRDMAAECFLLSPKRITKQTRAAAKGGFVFAEFYGDYFKQVARNLWNLIDLDGLKTADGVGLKEHLASKGITKLGACESRERSIPGTFEHHIEQVENRFWGDRFPVYDRWRDWWWGKYQERGWYRMKTGFVGRGVYKRNEVINAPIQGSAFHCLLRSLIEINRELKRKKMRSRIVGQIHDSLLADVHRAELQDYLAMVRRIMVDDTRRVWDWIITPLEIEADVAETNWFDKKPWRQEGVAWVAL